MLVFGLLDWGFLNVIFGLRTFEVMFITICIFLCLCTSKALTRYGIVVFSILISIVTDIIYFTVGWPILLFPSSIILYYVIFGLYEYIIPFLIDNFSDQISGLIIAIFKGILLPFRLFFIFVCKAIQAILCIISGLYRMIIRLAGDIIGLLLGSDNSYHFDDSYKYTSEPPQSEQGYPNEFHDYRGETQVNPINNFPMNPRKQ